MGCYWIKRWIFADHLMLLLNSEQGLQKELAGIVASYDGAGMKERDILSNPSKCTLQARGEALQLSEKLK